MNKLYPELDPKERIQSLIEHKVFPLFKEHAFKYVKSGISLKRNNVNFTYEIWFPRNNRNTGDVVCAFDVQAIIYAKNYNKWHKNTFGKKPINNILISEENSSIPNWNSKEFQLGYDLALDDNEKILNSLINNINKSVLPFFNKVSSYESAIEAVKENESYHLTPMLLDFCEIIENKEKSKEILLWFKKERGKGTEFTNETLEQVELREERLKSV